MNYGANDRSGGGGGAGNRGNRVSIDLDVQENRDWLGRVDRSIAAYEQLWMQTARRIQTDFDSLAGRMAGPAERLNLFTLDAFTNTLNSVKSLIDSFLNSVMNAGNMLRGWGASYFGGILGFGGEVMAVSTSFESLRASLDFAFQRFGVNTDELWSQIGEVAKNTSFTTSGLVDMVTTLGRSRIANPFKEVVTGAGDSITAIEALADMAASKGPGGMDSLRIALQEFMGGNTTSLRRRMDIPIEMTKALEKRLNGVVDAQERYNILAEETARFYGGAGRAMAGTSAFILAQFQDLKELLFAEIGGGANEVFKPILLEVQAFLGGILETERRTHGLRDAFAALARNVAAAVRPVLGVMKAVLEFITANPELVATLVRVLAIGAAVAYVAGTFMTTTVNVIQTVMSFVASIVAFLVFLPVIIIALIALSPIILAMVAAVVYMKKAWEENLGGFSEGLKKLGLVLKGVYELWSNLNGDVAHMSAETAQELNREGVLSWTIETFAALTRLRDGFVGVWEGLKLSFQSAWSYIRPSLVEMGILSADLGSEAGGGILDAINRMTPEQWTALGVAVGEAIGSFVTFGKDFMFIIATIAEAIRTIKNGVETLQVYFNGIWNQLTSLGNFLNENPIVARMMGLGAFVSTEPEAAPRPQQPLVQVDRQLVEENRAMQQGEYSLRGTTGEDRLEVARAIAATNRLLEMMGQRPIQLNIDGDRVAMAVAGAETRQASNRGLGRGE